MNKIQRHFVLYAIDQQHKLSEWECDFIDSLAEHDEKHLKNLLESAFLAGAKAGTRDVIKIKELLKPVTHIEEIDVIREEILVWDGRKYHIDYVRICGESGFHYMANGTEPEMWARLEDPEIKS